MKPGCIGIEEMTDDNIITVDIEGDKVSGRLAAGTTRSTSIPR